MLKVVANSACAICSTASNSLSNDLSSLDGW